MSFGFIPSKGQRKVVSVLVYVVYSVLGWPNYLRRLQWFRVHEYLELSGPEIILDIGAGDMQYTAQLAKNSDNVYAFDLDFQKDDASKLESKYGISSIRGNGLSMPFANSSADRILLSSVLQMVPDPQKLMLECGRVLRPGGFLVLSVPRKYRYLPAIVNSNSWLSRKMRQFFQLPDSIVSFENELNQRFGVLGPQGYYEISELRDLLSSASLDIVEYSCSPGSLGSWFWELAILGYYRFGGVVFHLLFFFYPMARLLQAIIPDGQGSEYVLKVKRK